MNLDALSDLQKARFPHLPLDCGRTHDPGVVDSDEWRDWSEFGATPGQLAIEDYLDRLGVRGKAILHIGIGSSGLARRFSRLASRIVGTTIVEAELRKANSLHLRNYAAVLHNKYSGSNDAVGGVFNFIVDNNPTSFCCCLRHLATMLDFYASRLAKGGQIVTEPEGLGWKIDAADALDWAFTFDDLAEVAALANLRAYRVTDSIYVLAQEKPRQITRLGLADYYARTGMRKFWRAVTLRGKLLGR